MPIPFEPWKDYPSLTFERLSAVAGIMRSARNSTVLLHDPEDGDNAWCLGCRVYARTMARIRTASMETDWLRVLPESQNLKFTFSIGLLPVKFYKGEPDEIPIRSLVRSFAELSQMRLAFDAEGIEPTHMLRLAVGADPAGNTTSITLVEVDEGGTPLRTFEIPRGESDNIVILKPKPIDLAPPKLEVIDDDVPYEIPNEITGEAFGSTGTKS